jgi:uncharacterized protein (DUF433 family)
MQSSRIPAWVRNRQFGREPRSSEHFEQLIARPNLSGIVEASSRLMARDYIEKRNGSYYVAGTRVSLDSIVYAFLRGAAAEAIALSYPVLSLEEVYGAIAFYLANRAEIDAMLGGIDRDFEALRKRTRDATPVLYNKLEKARRQMQSRRK